MEVLRPLAWLDRAQAMLHRATPLLMLSAVPVLLLARRTLLPRANWLGSVLRWGPVALGLWRNVSKRRL